MLNKYFNIILLKEHSNTSTIRNWLIWNVDDCSQWHQWKSLSETEVKYWWLTLWDIIVSGSDVHMMLSPSTPLTLNYDSRLSYQPRPQMSLAEPAECYHQLVESLAPGLEWRSEVLAVTGARTEWAWWPGPASRPINIQRERPGLRPSSVGRPEVTAAVWGLRTVRRPRHSLASEAWHSWSQHWEQLNSCVCLAITRGERHRCSPWGLGPRVMSQSHVRSRDKLQCWHMRAEWRESPDLVGRVLQWLLVIMWWTAEFCWMKMFLPSWNVTIWLLQINKFQHHGEVTRYLKWFDTLTERTGDPADNKDVILQGCPFLMSQVKQFYHHASCIALTAVLETN